MTSTKRRSQRRRRPKAAIITTPRATLLSLSFLADLSQHHYPLVAASVSTDGNVCKHHHHHGGGLLAAAAAAAAECNKLKARGRIKVHCSLGCKKEGHQSCWGLPSSRIIADIPRGGGGIGGWKKERQEKDTLKVKEEEDNNGDDDNGEPAPILSSPFLESFQQEVHEIVGDYRSDVRRTFQQLKKDLLASRGEVIIDDQDYKPLGTETKKRKKRENRRNRRSSKTLPKPKENGSFGSKSKKVKNKEEEEDLVREYPPLDDDFVVGDSDQDEDEVLERLLVKEPKRPSRKQHKNDESLSLEKSSGMEHGFRDKPDNDDGSWVGAKDKEPPTIEKKTPTNLWGNGEQEEAKKADTVLELAAEEYQVKTNEEEEKEKVGTAKSGAKTRKEQKIGAASKQPGSSIERQRRRRQHEQDDEYAPLGSSSSLSRRRGGVVDPRVWKALVVSFAFGGLFLLLGMAFKILSSALGLNN